MRHYTFHTKLQEVLKLVYISTCESTTMVTIVTTMVTIVTTMVTIVTQLVYTYFVQLVVTMVCVGYYLIRNNTGYDH